ncbi:hypothetical protein JVX90_18640 [Gordonia sp. PDNC005]|uniref:hypothetical protein n=1 Tax=unclassified Gordonia (in: high G+C Gram-positive bacteria) TaxID=2657482 RepID=UPI001962C556|nr:hypothetical protein [Gordonia sp. PDNC005]QRY62365.1 hypothetical protein JVX90_18640 [Gordonia sp. PDNC005]
MINDDDLEVLKRVCQSATSISSMTPRYLESLVSRPSWETNLIAMQVVVKLNFSLLIDDDSAPYVNLAVYREAMYPGVCDFLGWDREEFDYRMELFFNKNSTVPTRFENEDEDQEYRGVALLGCALFVLGVDVWDEREWTSTVDTLRKAKNVW